MRTLTITIDDRLEAAINNHIKNLKTESPGPNPGETISRPMTFNEFIQKQHNESLQFLQHSYSSPETEALERQRAELDAKLREAKIGKLTVA